MIKRHPNGDKGTRSVLHNANAAHVEPAKRTPQQKPEHKSKTSDWFHQFAHRISEIVGSPLSFVLALVAILLWAVLGPVFGFSDTWQLVINTATTIVTFLMVFLIQNTQNRDAKAIHLKLDELIHAIKGARNKLIDLEECSDEELARLEEQFKRIRQEARRDPHPQDKARGK
jgi:low affinity Fe/Cu permease